MVVAMSYLQAAFHYKDLANVMIDGRTLLSRVVRASLPVLVFNLPLPRFNTNTGVESMSESQWRKWEQIAFERQTCRTCTGSSM